jgi:hypothetical protein
LRLCLCRLQKEIKADHTEQRYKCPQKQCGKEYTSMDMWQLVSPAAGRDGKTTPRCTICGTEIVMVLDEGGKALGSMEDKKRRQRVRWGAGVAWHTQGVL